MGEPVRLMTSREHRVEAAAPFETFLKDHQTRLFGALCLMTGDRFEAEEIAQEAFLRVFERWDRVASMEDPAGYLFRVSMNVFRTRRRRAAMALRRTIRAGPEPDAFDVVEDREVVLRGLARVSRDERAALVATSLYGLSSDEAARLLGVKPSTVRARATRARAALRDAIGDER